MADVELSRQAVLDAIGALEQAERLLGQLSGILRALEDARGAIERLHQVELDTRIARIRLQTFVRDQPPEPPAPKLSLVVPKGTKR